MAATINPAASEGECPAVEATWASAKFIPIFCRVRWRIAVGVAVGSAGGDAVALVAEVPILPGGHRQTEDDLVA